jgi:hypothetical protein
VDRRQAPVGVAWEHRHDFRAQVVGDSRRHEEGDRLLGRDGDGRAQGQVGAAGGEGGERFPLRLDGGGDRQGAADVGVGKDEHGVPPAAFLDPRPSRSTPKSIRGWCCTVPFVRRIAVAGAEQAIAPYRRTATTRKPMWS